MEPLIEAVREKLETRIEAQLAFQEGRAGVEQHVAQLQHVECEVEHEPADAVARPAMTKIAEIRWKYWSTGTTTSSPAIADGTT